MSFTRRGLAWLGMMWLFNSGAKFGESSTADKYPVVFVLVPATSNLELQTSNLLRPNLRPFRTIGADVNLTPRSEHRLTELPVWGALPYLAERYGLQVA